MPGCSSMSGEMSPRELISDVPLPNWELIDEVSIALLESGLARFSTLQAVLPTMLSFDATSDEASQRSRKLLRISQLQIEYLLKSQNQLVQQIQKMKSELISKRKEVKRLKAAVFNEDAPLFKCASCGKVFVNQEFLASHLKRRHNDEKTETMK
ncbi:zinc finger, C2H2 type [Ostertagia ostertagi]